MGVPHSRVAAPGACPRSAARPKWGKCTNGSSHHPPCHPCGLTPRSSRAPTACHQAPATGTVYIVCGRGLASCRRCRLNSNVRQRKPPVVTVQLLRLQLANFQGQGQRTSDGQSANSSWKETEHLARLLRSVQTLGFQYFCLEGWRAAQPRQAGGRAASGGICGGSRQSTAPGQQSSASREVHPELRFGLRA